MDNWRQQLLVVNFFQTMEETATAMFQLSFGDPEFHIKIVHKPDLGQGGIIFDIMINLGEFKFMSSSFRLDEQQILNGMATFKHDLRALIAHVLFAQQQNASVVESIIGGLMRKYHRHYKETVILPKIKRQQDAAKNDQVQAHDGERQEGHQEASSSPVPGS